MATIENGILLLALGHKYYLDMAINLAVSIKHNDNTAHITLITNMDVIDGIFDNIIKVESESNNIRYKTMLYDLTPYKHTLYLDVDMIFIIDKKVSELFEVLKDDIFAIINQYKDNTCIWAEPNDIRAITNNYIDELPQYYSELIYFRKCKEMNAYFKEVKKAYNNNIIDCKRFSDGIPDELAYIVASMKTGVFPQKSNWCPIFWHFRNKKDANLQPYQLSKKYYAYSIGGNEIPVYVKANYNNLVTYYNREANVNTGYKGENKKHFLINRIHI